VEWIDKIEYQVNDQSRQKFAQTYSGIRPKLCIPQQFIIDFVTQTEQDLGVVGLVNLFGFEFPGFTAGLAISEQVSSVVQKVSH
jgi:hypothetical protein